MVITIIVKYFGLLTEKTGKKDEQIEIKHPITISELHNSLLNKYSQLNNCSYQIALNNTLVNDTSLLLNTNVEICLLPPYSGG